MEEAVKLSGRRCSICGSPLSSYNKSSTCLRHLDDKPRFEKQQSKEGKKSKSATIKRAEIPHLQPTASMEEIIQFVCEHFAVDERTLMLERGSRSNGTPTTRRRVLIYLLIQDGLCKQKDVAEHINNVSREGVSREYRQAVTLFREYLPHIQAIRARYGG